MEKNPAHEKYISDILEKHQNTIITHKIDNFLNKRKGDIKVCKMHMMKQATMLDGYLSVFPNYKHQKRKDGFGCSRLSPKSLGPVHHNIYGLPVATTIENFHQGAKMFTVDVKDGKVTEEAKRFREFFYKDPIPHRHKYSPEQLRNLTENKNKNIPLFSLYYDKNGNEKRYTYIQSRYFYCHWYEKLVVEEEDYKKLHQIIDNGTNILIQG